MDVEHPQLASAEQEVVLRGLARAAARPHGCFLEVGSWRGDSTVILGKVVRDYGGHLFCIDWWKGSADTELAEIACREDVYSLFWERMGREGLQDVVVPIRGRSDVVAPILKADAFRLVFLDGDHRRDAIARDIQNYAPLVTRDAGILCGHDCEGRINDYDPAFLDAGKDVDCHESVHCGVVSAVGAAFPTCSLNHSIWSVRANGSAGGWEPTNLAFPGIPDSQQSPPPPIAVTAYHNLLRYGNRVYAVPHSFAAFDVTDEQQRSQPGIVSAPTLAEALDLVRHELGVPMLMEEGYLGYNIVAYGGRYYAVEQEVGPIDLTGLTATAIADLQRQSRFLVAESHRAARLQVARVRLEAAGTV